MDPRQHPLRATAAAIGSLRAERRPPRMTHMQSANEGPADIIAKVSGVVNGGKREDDGLYFTNNEGIPLPDASHSKTIGGIPVASDVHLFQKQQHFNRSKPLERMVQPMRLRRLRLLRVPQRRHRPDQGQLPLLCQRKDPHVHPLLQRHLWPRVPRRGPQPARLRRQVLHHGGQLRRRRAQLPRLLLPRPHPRPRRHPPPVPKPCDRAARLRLAD